MKQTIALISYVLFHVSVVNVGEETSERVPNRIAIHFGGMALTYAELRQLTDRFATALAALGVSKGDRAAIHLPNCPQFAIAIMQY